MAKPWRPHLQLSIRTGLLAVTSIAVYLALFAAERRDAAMRAEVLRRLDDQFYTTGSGPYWWPPYTAWLHKLIGDEQPATLGFALFNNFSHVTDDTLRDLTVFQELYDLGLGGGTIQITEAGLSHLRELHNLEELDLADAPVSAESVAALRCAMPHCRIHWKEDDAAEVGMPDGQSKIGGGFF